MILSQITVTRHEANTLQTVLSLENLYYDCRLVYEVAISLKNTEVMTETQILYLGL